MYILNALVKFSYIFIFFLVFTLPSYGLSIDFLNPTPDNNAYINNSFFTINGSIISDISSYAFFNLDKSVIAWWRFDNDSSAGDSNSIVSDWSGRGNDGDINNAVYNSTAVFNNSISLDGNSDYIGISDGISINNSISISGWFLARQIMGDQPIYSLGTESTTEGFHRLYLQDSSLSWKWCDGNSISTATFSSYFGMERWYHYVITQDYMTGNLSLYIDGKLNYSSITEKSVDVTAKTSRIGAYGTNYFNGLIDDMILFNRELSSSEILPLFNASKYNLSSNFSSLKDGTYNYTFVAVDSSPNLQQISRNITVDSFQPWVISISPSDNLINNSEVIDFYYMVNDDSPIANCSLILNSTVNYTTYNPESNVQNNLTIQINSGNYIWNISCSDKAGNINTSMVRYLIAGAFPDLAINQSSINFSTENPVEGENITINATVRNIGNLNSNEFNVTFYEAILSEEKIIGSKIKITSLNAGDSITVSTNWTAKQGSYEVYAIIDYPDNSILESNESNNNASRIISVSSWQIIVGNLTGELVLSDSINFNLARWQVEDINGSNIYITDSDSTINFNTLWSFGRDLSNNTQADDFNELDRVLKTENLSDSINRTFTANEVARQEANISIFGRSIYYMPIINSTNSSEFITGILWNYGKDGSNGGTIGEYDSTDKEDIIFITKARNAQSGKFGYYNYEIRIPASLRSYFSNTQDTVTLYGEIA